MARGLGVGLFIGFLPVIGLQIILAVSLSRILNGNSLTAAVGTLITNPLTNIPVVYISVWLGDFILASIGLAEKISKSLSMEWIINNPGQLGTSFLVGCLVLGLVSSIAGYYGLHLFYQIKNKRV